VLVLPDGKSTGLTAPWPPHALAVATATHLSSLYHWVKKELTHTHSANTGETCPFVRCEMVFYETLRRMTPPNWRGNCGAQH